MALPVLSATLGRVTAQKHSQPSCAAQIRPSHSPDSARTCEANTERGRTQNLPGCQGSFRAPESQTHRHYPCPSLSILPFYFVGTKHKSTPIVFCLVTSNSTNKKQGSDRQNQAPIWDTYLCRVLLTGCCPAVLTQALGHLWASSLAVLPSSILLPFVLPDATGKTQSLQLQTRLLNLSLFFLSTSAANTSFQHTLSTHHHVWNASTKQTPSCACGTSTHPRAWLHPRGVRMQQGTGDSLSNHPCPKRRCPALLRAVGNITRLSAPAYPSRPGVSLAVGELCFGTGQPGSRRPGLARRPPQGTAATSRDGLQLCSSSPAAGAAVTCVPGQLGPVRSPGNTDLHRWLHWCTDLWCFVAKKVMLKDRLAFENEAHPSNISSPV